MDARVGLQRDARQLNGPGREVVGDGIRIMGTDDGDFVTTPAQLLVEQARLEHRTVGVWDTNEVAQESDPERTAEAEPKVPRKAWLSLRRIAGRQKCCRWMPARWNRRSEARLWRKRSLEQRMKVVDVTEFYSERGGGVRSYLEGKATHSMPTRSPIDRARSRTRRTVDPRHVRRPGRTTPRPTIPPTTCSGAPTRSVKRIAAERPDVLEIHSPYVAAAGRDDRARPRRSASAPSSGTRTSSTRTGASWPSESRERADPLSALGLGSPDRPRLRGDVLREPWQVDKLARTACPTWSSCPSAWTRTSSVPGARTARSGRAAAR